MNVELTPVTSSTIDAFGYDQALNELYVQFKSGATYTYAGVSESVYAELCEAESTDFGCSRPYLNPSGPVNTPFCTRA